MFVRSDIALQIKQYVLRFIFVMGSCLVLALLINLIFDIDMHRQLIFVGAIAMIMPSKKKYVPKKK